MHICIHTYIHIYTYIHTYITLYKEIDWAGVMDAYDAVAGTEGLGDVERGRGGAASAVCVCLYICIYIER